MMLFVAQKKASSAFILTENSQQQYMIQLLHAEGADNTREACGATALSLSLQCHSCPVCLAGCASTVISWP